MSSVYTPHRDSGTRYATLPGMPATPTGPPMHAPKVGMTPATTVRGPASWAPTRAAMSNGLNTSWGPQQPSPQPLNQSWAQTKVNSTWAPMHNATGLNQSQAPPSAPNFGSPAASTKDEDKPHPAPPGELLSFQWRCDFVGIDTGLAELPENEMPTSAHNVYSGGREQWAQRILGTTSTPAAASKSVLGPD
jgi:hypothetical protein